MIKRLFICILVFVLAGSVYSQGLYFDIGFGLGSATTEIDGEDVGDSLGSGVDEVGVDLGLKVGYGPIAGMPLYIAGTLEGIGHRFDDGTNYIQFNSYLLGPSLIVYPIPLIQIAGSIGHSWVSNQSDLPISFHDSESGFAGDLSVALDLGQKNHGFLLGLKYFTSTNTLETSKAEQNSSMLSIFVKYAYRHK
ncbi:hypothetical protein B4O97_18740 [Marispirochaeta aestuarii]|uniref:Outer membrane protein beta-barrel domain-containing protein n=1 Tax=Marispirochaeta aestuarii TaxID=1963862 RepID=A0A1Y1RSW9_9SPIO|nr:hypothetical protein [Marispirochaeta aestuarii]ORC29892.1 hypothetical protein B4O97_18740 [Marispirochaeta aestuarii]